MPQQHEENAAAAATDVAVIKGEKKGFFDKIKEKLPVLVKSKDTTCVCVSSAPAGGGGGGGGEEVEVKEKIKGYYERMKEKITGFTLPMSRDAQDQENVKPTATTATTTTTTA